MTTRFSALVFSFDRPCQLELMLRSLKEHLAALADISITAYYDFSSFEFESGYRLVAEIHPWVRFVREQKEMSKKLQISSLIAAHPGHYFAFFVDDDVIINPLSFEEPEFEQLNSAPDLLAISMRLHARVTYCQPLGKDITAPKLTKKELGTSGVIRRHRTNCCKTQPTG